MSSVFPQMRLKGCAAYRFDRFEARVRPGVLLREHKRIRIEELPFQMLLILLETPGQVVTKEELRDRLWAGRSFGELDSSLHVAAAKLREALGESAGEPRFIETVRRRGYQFVGEVLPVFDPPSEVPGEPPQPEIISQAEDHRFGWRVPVMVALSLLAISCTIPATVFGYRYMHRPLAGSQDKVVIGGFANSTGDDAFSGFGHAFRVKLEESPYLSVVSDREFRQTLKLSGQASLPDELQACVSLGGKILLTGTVVSESPGYQVSVTARKCANGSVLTTQRAHSDSRDQVLSALDFATGKLRAHLGETDSSLQKFNVPLAQATTASLAALKAFTQGEEKRAQGREFEAISDYKLAVDLDPQFAMAYARLGGIYSNAAEFRLSSAYFTKAFDLRERTTDRERLYIASHYYSSATGEVQRSIDAYQLWLSVYPRDISPAISLAAQYLMVGEPAKAVEPALAALRLDPSSGMAHSILSRAYLEIENYAGVQALCQNEPGNGDVVMLHQSCFLLAFLQNDNAAMQRQLDWAHGDPAESELIDEAAWVAMYRGEVNEGHRLFEQARQIALGHDFGEQAAAVDLDEAGLDADFGYFAEARKHALHALTLAPNSTTTQALAALALARAGNIARAHAEAVKAAAASPQDTILNSAELASVRAAIQLQQRDPEEAIRSLEETRPLDFCTPMALAPAYYRGLSYLQKKQFDKASEEFQHVIEHRAFMPDSPYIGLAYLGLSESQHLAGKGKLAAQADRAIRAIWKDADPQFLPLRSETPAILNSPRRNISFSRPR
jgi:DNA-binding winged helix-turn-helix (wHTH) protein/tetratricopeptide (TPR) repeat protein